MEMMKKPIEKYWSMFKAAFPFMLIIWAVTIVTILALRTTAPDAINIDPSLAKIMLGLVFTLVTPLVHFWFKNRKAGAK